MSIGSISPVGNPVKSLSKEQIHALEQELGASLKNGTLKAKDLTPYFKKPETSGPRPPQYYDRYEGNTVVQNKGTGGITVISRYTEDGRPIYTALDANKSAAAGAPTHGFFYQSTDFLLDAAKEYAKLGENEVFRYRNIADGGFLSDALSFFTDGNYSSEEMYSLENQMTDVVFELAEQIKNGESPDLTKLQTKLTIGGVDFTASQLLDFQKVGGELKDAFNEITVGPLDVQRFGKMGMAKALANHYGSDKGEAGAMFSSAMDRLYDKGVAIVEESAAQPIYGPPWNSYEQSKIKTSMAIRDTFSTLDTSSKENLAKDFAEKLATVRSMVQNHCNQFNVPPSQVGLSGDTAELMKYFNSWLDKM